MAVGSLVADGDDEGTYSLISGKGFGYETPDADHSPSVRHIRQATDATLGRSVFLFDIHIGTDLNKGADVDRQRNEIKTDNSSPSSMVAQEGETLECRWLFKLPAGMQTTSEFTHVHQVKGIDNASGTADIGKPNITFTCRSTGAGQEFQVIYVAPAAEGSGLTYLANVDLADFLGEWVEVSESMVCSSPGGSYSVTIRRLCDSATLVDASQDGLKMWRDGAVGMRPKWGIYRSFGSDHSLAGELRDETLKFADFYVTAH
jgi:hypothetical protein